LSCRADAGISNYWECRQAPDRWSLIVIAAAWTRKNDEDRMSASTATASPCHTAAQGLSTPQANPFVLPPIHSTDGLNEAILSRTTIAALRAQFERPKTAKHRKKYNKNIRKKPDQKKQ